MLPQRDSNPRYQQPSDQALHPKTGLPPERASANIRTVKKNTEAGLDASKEMYLFIYLFICILCNDAFSSSDYTDSIQRMMSE
jgi:hypothetical protein